VKLIFGQGVEPDGSAYRGVTASGARVAVSIDDRLRLVVVWLEPGGSLRWPDGHGEEAVYVLEGAVDVEGVTVPAGGAVVLHAGAGRTLTAPGGARLAHFGADGSGDGDGDYHLLGPGGRYRSGSPTGSQATWFADSTCDGCDVALFRVERDTPGNRGRGHSHSADEILFLVEGGIRLGVHQVPTGNAVFIPADTRYAVTCGEVKHAFLNYRPTASLQLYEGDTEPMVETGLGRGGSEVGDVLR
jgi:quercetin dioxygenase-like cupin family protein